MTEASPTPEQQALAARLDRLAQRRAPAATGPVTQDVPRRARRHPAKTARYAAVGLSVLSTAGLTSLFVTEASGSTQVGSAAIVSGSSPASGSSPVTSTSTSATTGSPAGLVPTVVDGAVSHNRWGNVQVEATFAADGSLTSVTALETPGGRGRSIEINDYAVPQLDAEAVDVQSAQVHTISGATYTSDSYRSSLQSAIDVARAAGATDLS